MSQLNQEYLLTLFRTVQEGAANNTYAILPAEAEETKALAKAKYIKLSKRLHNADGNVGATLEEGATEADLRIDFEIPDFNTAPVAPVVPESAAEAPFVLEPAPAAETPVEIAPAPFAEVAQPVAEVPAAPFQEIAQTAPVVEAQQPEFAPMTTQVQAPEVTQAHIEQLTAEQQEALGQAPVEEHDGLKVIGDNDHEVIAVARTRNGEVEIDVGVPFVTKVSAAEKKEKNKGLEHHPFGEIAKVKMANPATAPSFHLANRAVKDISNSVRRANDKYEKEGSQVTFRAAAATEDDPKGPGVRVFALFLHEAPPQRRSSKKDAETQEEGQE